MADLSFAPVAGRVPQQQQMSLADMLNLARGVQAYQQTQQLNPLQLQQAQTELMRLQAIAPEEIKRAQAESKVAEATVAPRITSATQAAETATVGTESARLKLAAERQQGIANRLTALINNPAVISAEQNPQTANPQGLAELMRQYGEQQGKELGVPADQIATLTKPYIEMAASSPAGLRAFLKERLLTGMDNSARAATMQPGGPMIQTGAGGYQAQTNIFGPNAPGTIVPGTMYSAQMGPGATRVITPEQAQAMGKPELAGATVTLGVQSPLPGVSTPQMQQAGAPIVTGLSPTQAAPIQQLPAMAGEHFARVQKESEGAQSAIGVLQNIKKYASEAFTGVGGARKELAAGIANAVGIPAYEAEKTATDVLAKNSNLLALAGGNTDLARTLAEAANPNKKMNADAIRIAADQLIGIKRMTLAQQQFMSQYQTNPQQYMAAKARFDSIADPRLFQEWTQKDIAKMKQSMSEMEFREFVNKARAAKELGLLPELGGR